jgi:hypothetical protein
MNPIRLIACAVIAVRYCQLTLSGTAAGLGAGTCASFTGSGSGTSLTTSAVTGTIMIGDTVAGTGVPGGTTIVSQTSGTPGGAGVYVTSAATTSSMASLTSGSIPAGATMVYLVLETAAARYRDDGAAPTTSVGQPIAQNGTLFYSGTISAMKLIAQTGSPVLDMLFYR